MPLRRALRLGLRLGVVWALFSAVGLLFVRPIVSGLIPLVERVIDSIQPDYTAYVSLADGAHDPEIWLRCTALHELDLPSGRVPYLGAYHCATTDAIHALVPLVIYAVAVAGWPISRSREILKRLLLSVAFLPLIAAVTTPLLLVGLVDSRLHTISSHDYFSALTRPFVFMELGGTWLLAIIAGVVCIRLAAAAPAGPRPA